MPVWNIVMATQYRMSEISNSWNSLFLNVLMTLAPIGVVEGSVSAYLFSSIVKAGTSMQAMATAARIAMVTR